MTQLSDTNYEALLAGPEYDPMLEAAHFLSNVVGLDPKSPHQEKTPARFVRMLRELTTPEKFEFTTFPNDGYDEMIVQGDIPFTSLCEHHVVPFVGQAYIGYVPRDALAGLSKLARTVKYFAAGLQTQERLTGHVADFLQEKLDPRGVAVVIRARHLCMEIRGVQTPGALTTTAAMLGVFGDHSRTAKAEFMTWINGHQGR